MKIATDETNVVAKWIAKQRDESSRIYSARLSLEPEIGYGLFWDINIDIVRLAVRAQCAELPDCTVFRWVRNGLPDRRERSP